MEKLKNKKFWEAAGIRALRTAIQTAIAALSTTALLADVDILAVVGTSVIAGVCSILTSVLSGLPEVEESEVE